MPKKDGGGVKAAGSTRKSGKAAGVTGAAVKKAGAKAAKKRAPKSGGKKN